MCGIKRTAYIICSVLLLTGCRKEVITTEETVTSTETTVAVYNAIDKMGVVHVDTVVYEDEGMTKVFL